MGWLRLVGSFKSKVFFAKETNKRDDILQKRAIILRSLLIVATPYTHIFTMAFTSALLSGNVFFLRTYSFWERFTSCYLCVCVCVCIGIRTCIYYIGSHTQTHTYFQHDIYECASFWECVLSENVSRDVTWVCVCVYRYTHMNLLHSFTHTNTHIFNMTFTYTYFQ